jgi:hypothetical protein
MVEGRLRREKKRWRQNLYIVMRKKKSKIRNIQREERCEIKLKIKLNGELLNTTLVNYKMLH